MNATNTPALWVQELTIKASSQDNIPEKCTHCGSATYGTFTAPTATPSELEAQTGVPPAETKKSKKTWLGETREEGKLTENEGSLIMICLLIFTIGLWALCSYGSYCDDLEEHRRLVDEIKKELEG